MIGAVIALSGLILATPAGFGSADGKVKAKVPVNRPIKRSGPKKETLERKAAEDERAAVVVSDLELQPGAKVPEGVQLEPLLRELMAPSQKLRLVFTPGCTELECLRKAAAAEATNHLIFLSMDSERRVSLLLNELPGRGLLRQRQTPPLEASDRFTEELSAAMSSLLGLGTEQEGRFEAEAAPEPVAGEDAETLAKRGQLIQNATYTVYAGAGLLGLGLTVGTMAAINASQWRNTSYRFEDGAYREQIRGIAQTRALVADTLLISGLIAGGTGYYLQRKAVAGPAGKLTLGWGQDTWREPETPPDTATSSEPLAPPESPTTPAAKEGAEP